MALLFKIILCHKNSEKTGYVSALSLYQDKRVVAAVEAAKAKEENGDYELNISIIDEDSNVSFKQKIFSENEKKLKDLMKEIVEFVNDITPLYAYYVSLVGPLCGYYMKAKADDREIVKQWAAKALSKMCCDVYKPEQLEGKDNFDRTKVIGETVILTVEDGIIYCNY